METFSETFSSKIVGTLPLPASGTKLYAVHIASVGGGGGYIMQLKSPKWARNQTKIHNGLKRFFMVTI